MPLVLYDSLTRSARPFVPRDARRVTVYACGPTVYDHVHIGNWSLAVVADVLVRWLRESGYPVTYVQNITDVEDKIIRDSQAAGQSRATFTQRWEALYLEGMEALRARAQVNHFPRATEHVDGMVELVQALLDKGFAYLAEDHSIYYRVTAFKGYGRLAGIRPEDLLAGASGRVRADEYEKDAVADFALWKAYVPEDGDVYWEPTFTVNGEPCIVKGRPGWHIECSAMSRALLGDQFDIHLGGEDLLFPHHQNEIAQSEAALGKAPLVGYWLHHKHLLVGGAKMSKSKKNFYTLKDLVDRYGPSIVAGFRYLLASSHYRQSLNFTFDALDGAQATVRNLRDAYERLGRLAGAVDASTFADAAQARFAAAMDNDLQTPEALGALHTLVGECNRRQQAGTLTAGDAAAARALLARADRVLGLFLEDDARALSAAQATLVQARLDARQRRDWKEADRLRDVLAKDGIAVKDTPDGQVVSFL